MNELKSIIDSLPIWSYVLIATMTGIGMVAQMGLYSKANQKAISAVVPVWNIFSFLNIVGRPKSHSLWLILPGLGILATIALYIKPILAAIKSIMDPIMILDFEPLIIPTAICAGLLMVLTVFISKVYIEIAKSFGKSKTSDHVLIVVLNIMYIVNMGLSYDIKYFAPAYKYKKDGLEMPKRVPKKKKKKKVIA
jgi:hypothetical protein